MTRVVVFTMVLSLMLCGTTYAQLPGKLKKGAERVMQGRLGGDQGEEQEGADAAQADAKSGARPAANKDKSREYPPGLSFSTVLNGVKLLPKKGKFSLHQIQTTFLPDNCTEGSTVLRTADGKELFQWDWKPDRLQTPYALMNVHKRTNLQTGETQSAGFIEMTTPGDYVLDFYLPSEHFYTYPFTVVKLSGDDPFASSDCYLLDGDWEDWGYMYYRDAKPDQSLHWKLWLRNKGSEPRDVKVRIEVTRDADGQLVCTSRGAVTYGLKPDWVRYDFDLIFPKELTSGGQYFKAKDLLGTDGDYTLTTKIDDEVYGVWKFTVAGGKFQYAGRAVRGEADPLTFIEGGRDAFWYHRAK